MIDRRPIMLKGRSPLLDLPAHDDAMDTGHVFRINDAGESVCECGENIGVVTWTVEDLLHHVCPKCEWTQDAIPTVDTCPKCATNLVAQGRDVR